MGFGYKFRDVMKIIIISVLIIFSATLSGCITDDSSKKNKDESVEEVHGIFLPPDHKSFNITQHFGLWSPKSNYSSYGELTDYTSIYTRLINTNDHANYVQSFEFDYEVIFEPPKDKDGNLIYQYYNRYERSTRSVMNVFTDIDFGVDTFLQYSNYEQMRSGILNITNDTLIDGQGLDFYPPRIITIFDYSGISNTGSTGEVSVKNNGDKTDVLAKVEFDHFVERTVDNITETEWKTDRFQIVIPMSNSEVVKISARFPANARFPYMAYVEANGDRHPISDLYEYESFQRWELRYAEAGDTSYGNLTIERI